MHNLFLNINYDFLSNFRIYLLFKVISNVRLEPQLYLKVCLLQTTFWVMLKNGIVRSLLHLNSKSDYSTSHSVVFNVTTIN